MFDPALLMHEAARSVAAEAGWLTRRAIRCSAEARTGTTGVRSFAKAAAARGESESDDFDVHDWRPQSD